MWRVETDESTDEPRVAVKRLSMPLILDVSPYTSTRGWRFAMEPVTGFDYRTVPTTPNLAIVDGVTLAEVTEGTFPLTIATFDGEKNVWALTLKALECHFTLSTPRTDPARTASFVYESDTGVLLRNCHGTYRPCVVANGGVLTLAEVKEDLAGFSESILSTIDVRREATGRDDYVFCEATRRLLAPSSGQIIGQYGSKDNIVVGPRVANLSSLASFRWSPREFAYIQELNVVLRKSAMGVVGVGRVVAREHLSLQKLLDRSVMRDLVPSKRGYLSFAIRGRSVPVDLQRGRTLNFGTWEGYVDPKEDRIKVVRVIG